MISTIYSQSYLWRHVHNPKNEFLTHSWGYGILLLSILTTEGKRLHYQLRKQFNSFACLLIFFMDFSGYSEDWFYLHYILFKINFMVHRQNITMLKDYLSKRQVSLDYIERQQQVISQENVSLVMYCLTAKQKNTFQLFCHSHSTMFMEPAQLT